MKVEINLIVLYCIKLCSNMLRQRGICYARCNSLIRNFSSCSLNVKVKLFNHFRLSYVYIHTKFPNRCDSCTYIYVHGLCDRNMGLLTDTLRYHHTLHTRCSRASGLQLAAILQHVYQRKKSGVYSELSAVFGKFWKITIVGPSSIHRLVLNTTAHYMDFLP